MSAAEQALQRDVADHPDDDAPRLVYADWLEERGDPRAEFIRVQCELANMDPYDPRRTELQSRELQLIRQHSKGWAGSLRGYARRWWFRRGFVERVGLKAEKFLDREEELFGMFPVRGVRLTHADGPELAQLSRSDRLCNLEWLDLPQGFRQYRRPYRADKLVFSLKLKPYNNLKELHLSGAPIGDDNIREIVNIPSLANLETLGLTDVGLTPTGVEHIVESAQMRNVRNLLLSSSTNISTSYSEDFVGPLPRALAPLMDRLETLDVTRCCITRPGAIELCSQLNSGSLRYLSLNGNQLYDTEYTGTSISFREVIECPLFASLVTLDLSSCYVDTLDEIDSLVSRQEFESICEFSLNNSVVGNVGADLIADSPYGMQLMDLSLNAGVPSPYYTRETGKIEDAGFQSLLISPNLPRLASLSLRRNGITAEGIRSLLESPALQRLYYLDLRDNQIGDEGARLLAAHGPWPRLAKLNIRNNGLSSTAKDDVRNSLGYRVVF